jgi:O-acetyl-ADP-ribose deacetylase
MVTKIKGDITKIEADVIMSAANTELKHGGGVALAIARAAGEKLEKESREIGFVPLGGFATTSAGKLKAKVVVHVPTIDYERGPRCITYEELESVWKKVLEYCRSHGYKTVATPLLGAGVVGLAPDKVEKIITDGAVNFPEFQISIVGL